MFKRSLAMREQAFGREHPDVATTLNNLARLLTMEVRLVYDSSVWLLYLFLEAGSQI